MFTTTIRLEEDFNERLRIAMAKRRVKTLQQAVQEGLELWLAQDDQPRPAAAATPAIAPAEGMTEAERRYAEALVEFARTHTQDAVNVVLAAIEYDKGKKK